MNLSLPMLTTVGLLTISNNTALTILTLPALMTVNGGLTISNPGLTSLSLPALTSVAMCPVACSGLGMDVNGATLASVSLPALTSVRDLTVSDSPMLTSLSWRSSTAGKGSTGFAATI